MQGHILQPMTTLMFQHSKNFADIAKFFISCKRNPKTQGRLSFGAGVGGAQAPKPSSWLQYARGTTQLNCLALRHKATSSFTLTSTILQDLCCLCLTVVITSKRVQCFQSVFERAAFSFLSYCCCWHKTIEHSSVCDRVATMKCE